MLFRILRQRLALLVSSCVLGLGAPAQGAGAVDAQAWPTSTPAAQGMDAKALETIRQDLPVSFADLRSVVVVKNGVLVFEYRRPGLAPDGLDEMQSVTKSVVSALFGLALQDGALTTLDVPFVKYLPASAGAPDDRRARDITLRHLLNLTAGYQQESRTDRLMRKVGLKTPLQTAMDRDVVSPPGTAFAYDDVTCYITSAVLTSATRRNAADYAAERLFGPLGITQFSWPTDRWNVSSGHSGLMLKARDMARFGQLYLQNGQWGGRQLLSEAYVLESTREQSPGRPHERYGYMWWVAPNAVGRAPFTARGHGGQHIHVDPAFKLVVVTTAEPTQESDARRQAHKLIYERIVPAAKGPAAR